MIVPLISLDLETTGLEPGQHYPWEIAWRTALHDTAAGTLTVLQDFASFIESIIGRLDPVGLNIGGYAERYDRREASPMVDIIVLLGRHLDELRTIAVDLMRAQGDEAGKPVPVHLVGACPQFDHAMLAPWLGWAHRHWHHHLIDVETLLAGSAGYGPPYDTDVLTELMEQRLGVTWDRSRQHEAGADVEWNLALYAAAYELKAPGGAPWQLLSPASS